MNTALIVAAGSGTRFGSDQPKQFLHLLGRPVIIHCLETFQQCSAVDEIVLVVSEYGREAFESLAGRYSFSKLTSIVTGGITRAHSVKNGFEFIEPHPDAIVAVHDGARPLVTADEIERVIAKASQTGAACLVAEITDTVKRVEAGSIVETVDRAHLRRALTPQAFRYDILRRAFEGSPLDEAVTDECYLVERLGLPISCVEGSHRNIKITRPEDLRLATTLLAGEQ